MRKLTSAAALLLALTLLPACGGANSPQSGEADARTQSQAEATAIPTSAAPLPTRPRRLDHELTQTANSARAAPAKGPAAAEQKGSGSSSRTPQAGNQKGQRPANTTAAATAEQIAGMVPEDQQTNHRVLLQDIYDRIDLEQFALDPSLPIGEPEWQKKSRNEPKDDDFIPSTMSYPEVFEHPYLHLFPMLQNSVERKIRAKELQDFGYDPTLYTNHLDDERFEDTSMTVGRLMYFIYNPWFEPIYLKLKRERKPQLNGSAQFVASGEYLIWRRDKKEVETGPYWFGENSTRGAGRLQSQGEELYKDRKVRDGRVLIWRRQNLCSSAWSRWRIPGRPGESGIPFRPSCA